MTTENITNVQDLLVPITRTEITERWLDVPETVVGGQIAHKIAYIDVYITDIKGVERHILKRPQYITGDLVKRRETLLANKSNAQKTLTEIANEIISIDRRLEQLG
jgi:hypothetical protein